MPAKAAAAPKMMAAAMTINKNKELGIRFSIWFLHELTLVTKYTIPTLISPPYQ